MNIVSIDTADRPLIHVKFARIVCRLKISAVDRFATVILVLAVLGNAQLVSPGAAAEADVAAGAALAKRLCARCHSVDASGKSPIANAPPFRTFKSKWPLSYLEEALAEGIVTGHEEMPEVRLSPDEIEQLLSHIESLPVQSE